ncbi:MAG: AraC family transcriptional regulator ligand-binding domain-containing protein [Oleispira sp.]
MNNLINCEAKVFPWHLHPAQLYSMAMEFGLSSRDLLAAGKLTSEDIKQPDLYISWQQYSSIASCLNKEGLDAHWGLELGQRLTMASHGLLSLAIMNCSTWRQALDLMIQYKNLVTALFYIEVKETDSHIILELHPEFTRSELLTQYIDCFFTIVYQVIYQLSSLKEELKSETSGLIIHIKSDRELAQAEIEKIFHGNCIDKSYGNQICIHKDYLDSEIHSGHAANSVAANSMITLLRGQLAQQSGGSENTGANKGELHVLHDIFRQQEYSQEQCATLLNTSLTSFKRKLSLAQTSFNKELIQFRLNEACFHLVHSELENDDISQLLGFKDTGSFRRFFKTHMGSTPSEYRVRGNL